MFGGENSMHKCKIKILVFSKLKTLFLQANRMIEPHFEIEKLKNSLAMKAGKSQASIYKMTILTIAPD